MEEGSIIQFIVPDIYDMCLEEAKSGSMRGGNGEGAVLYATMKNKGIVVFKNRSRHRRDWLKDYGLSCSGFQEHAEQAVLNDALRFVRDNNDEMLGVAMFVAGFIEGKPYRYKKRTYICMNCASYIKEVLPVYSTYIYLPALEGGWYVFSPFELYREAVGMYAEFNKTSDARRESLEVIEVEN